MATIGMSRIALGLATFALLAGCGSTATADPTDIKAAQGCELSQQILQEASKGSAFPGGNLDKINAAGEKLQPIASDLLAGTAEAKAAGKPEPKWSTLGGNFITELADLNGSNLDGYTKDQDAIIADCNKIPDIAKRAGGFTK